MNLKRQFLTGIENFDQEWKMFLVQSSMAHELSTVMSNQPVKVVSRQWAVCDHADIARPVANFPGLSHRRGGGQILAIELLQPTASPNALLQDGLKSQRI